MNDLKTASVLAFERKLDTSDARFTAGAWEKCDAAGEWPAVAVREKAVRGTISNRLSAKEQDPAKLDASIENPNLQTVDVATLPASADTLKVHFTLRVLGGAGTPSACNNSAYRLKLQQIVRSYVEECGFSELARRYAMNIANARFLWRNRIGAEAVRVDVRKIAHGDTAQNWRFDALRQPWRDFNTGANDVTALANTIEEGLKGSRYVLLDIAAFVRVGAGQEVFPSQELILEQSSSGRGRKSKTLYTVGETAAMHSQKIGNALRTIDTWYPDYAQAGHSLGPIAVEPYGSVTSQGRAYRQPKQKRDFYTLLDNWILKDKAPEQGDQHFVMAILIRGGVFGKSEKK